LLSQSRSSSHNLTTIPPCRAIAPLCAPTTEVQPLEVAIGKQKCVLIDTPGDTM
jgi:hypothetical protein